jgi:hypothetical protein
MNSQQKTREEWYLHIEEHKKSGLTQVEFCKQKGLVLANFVYYLQQYRKQNNILSKESHSFSPVVVQTQNNSSSNEIKIDLPNGFRCQVSCNTHPDQLKKILGVLLLC